MHLMCSLPVVVHCKRKQKYKYLDSNRAQWASHCLGFTELYMSNLHFGRMWHLSNSSVLKRDKGNVNEKVTNNILS